MSDFYAFPDKPAFVSASVHVRAGVCSTVSVMNLSSTSQCCKSYASVFRLYSLGYVPARACVCVCVCG